MKILKNYWYCFQFLLYYRCKKWVGGKKDAVVYCHTFFTGSPEQPA